jgi:hypothetical protein
MGFVFGQLVFGAMFEKIPMCSEMRKEQVVVLSMGGARRKSKKREKRE